MRIFVTGASGFIGSAFVRAALGAGHEVLALVRAPERAATLGSHPALDIVTGTLAEPPWTAIARFAPETCLHAAWITQPADYRASDENVRLQAESVALARGLLEQGARRIVALGTCEEYAPAAGRLDEARAALAPASAYARAKHELRLALEAAARLARAHLTWARIFQPYGPGEPSTRMPSLVIQRVRNGQPVMLRTPAALRDWIHVEDVASALLHLAQRGADGIFNVGTGVGHTVEQVARSIAHRLGQPDLVMLPPPAGRGMDALVADVTRLRGLGWTPHLDLDMGLARLIEHTR
ncbi:MAG TPA: NAD(P)-dependent oxidoreductase [Methylomirabilota bacterium]|nr:NAD(P)-dependent oxidoreductase [Methylomirabilota bacterium]